MTGAPVPLSVDGMTLLSNLQRLGKVGRGPAGAVSRVAFTEDFLLGRDIVAQMMAEAGMQTWVDEAGNLFGRFGEATAGTPGSPVVMVGSHLDTVPEGGLLDGAYGVLAGIAAVAALAEVAAQPAQRVVVAGFCNEEGAFGTAGVTGSRAVAGLLSADELSRPDITGTTLAQRNASVAGPCSARWPHGSLSAYLEAHIEQGPVLEAEGLRLGVVSAITGRALVNITVHGVQGHAGTTSMELRADALTGAAEVVLIMEELARGGSVRVATTGAVKCEPGARNIVPGKVRLSAEMRDSDLKRLLDAVSVLGSRAHDICERRGLRFEADLVDIVKPTPTAPELQAALHRAASQLGEKARDMDSGAGHDAQSLAHIAPVGMVFVPSMSGASHCKEEASEPEDLVLGVQVLANALYDLAVPG